MKRLRHMNRSLTTLAMTAMIVLLGAIYPLALQLVHRPKEHLADWLADGATATAAVIVALAASEFYTRLHSESETYERLLRLRGEIILNIERAHTLHAWLKSDRRAAARIMTFPDYIWRAIRDDVRHDLDDETLYALEGFYGRLRILQRAESVRVDSLNEGRKACEASAATKHAMRNMIEQANRTLDILPENGAKLSIRAQQMLETPPARQPKPEGQLTLDFTEKV